MQVDSLDINLEHVMFVIVRMWPRVFSAHWPKAQHLSSLQVGHAERRRNSTQPMCRKMAQNAAESPTAGHVARPRAFPLARSTAKLRKEVNSCCCPDDGRSSCGPFQSWSVGGGSRCFEVCAVHAQGKAPATKATPIPLVTEELQ